MNFDMKYIDADKLKKLIDEKWKELANKNLKVGGNKWDAEINTYLSVLTLIDSIEQDEPESSNSKFTFPSALYARTIDNKTIDVSYTPQSLDVVEYIKNDQTEHPEEDLKKELDEWMNYGPHKSYPWCTLPDIIKITAKHFYELGLKARKED